ncbi:MAG TPA: ABC transporter substrate-binding protein [Ktedonobacterales bacterium]|nr:ABC transporter substrate-binding protein [Ktedonobacterales bacterium]
MNHDRLFAIVVILALLASTGTAVIVATGAHQHTTVQISGGGPFTSSAQATQSAGGTPSSGGGGGGTYSGSGSSQTQGVSGDTIKVGAIFSESNGIDSTVEEDTVRAYFQSVNAQGGVNGRKLELVSYDDGLNGDTAYAEAARLDQQDHVFAVVGWLAPFGEARAAPYLEQHGIPIVGGLGVPEEFNSPVSFPVSPIFAKDGFALGAYGAGTLHYHHIGVFLTQTAGINDVANGIKQGAAAHGVTVNDNDIVFVPFAATNFEQYLLQFQSEGVDGLVTQLDPFSYVRLFQAEQRTNKIFHQLAGAGVDKQSVDAAIGSQLVGTYGFMPYLEAQGNPTGNAEVNAYNATVTRYYPSQAQNMDAFSEGTWVAARLFVDALAKLGNNVTRAGLVNALDSGAYDVGGMAPELNYQRAGSSHAASNCASYISYTSNRRWQVVVPPPYYICY